MRVVYLLTSLGVGGAEKQALALAERMAQRGHAVALVVLMPRLAHEWPNSLPVTHLDVRKSPASALAGLRRAHAFLRGFRPDLVHSHSFHANIFARLLRLGGPKFAVLSTVHNVYEGGWHRMLAYRITDFLSRRTVAVSEAAAGRFTRLGAVPRRKCSVILNGIDVDSFRSDPDRRARMRAEMGLAAAPEDAEFVWIAVGRVSPAKDYPNLMPAFSQAHTAHPNCQLWIAGEPSRSPGTRKKAAVFGYSMTRQARNQVRWLGLRRDIPALLDAADGFVLSSAWEGMPLAVGEAMAMEKPVVATDVGGVRELVGNSGTLVEAKNPHALAEAVIATMRQSREERAAQGRAARERIVSHFSMDASASAWEALYTEMLG
jgi:glycosyltransferase involved in cell wall biosynthesis